MNWLNIKLVSLRSPEYVGSDPVSRATWWNVVAYCAEQENGGKIVGGKAWKDRQWQQTCGVTAEEVNSAAMLLSWVGDDLVVWNYPTEKEAEIRVKREAGKVGGARSGEARSKQTFDDNRSSASSTPSISDSTERKEKEKENSKKKEKEPADVFASLPVELDFPEFRKAWVEYVAYRKKRKIEALLPESVILQWKKFATWGVELSIQQIEETMSQGWQGIFAPKAGSKPVTPKIQPRQTVNWTPESFQTPAELLANRKAKEAQEESRNGHHG